MVTLRTRLAVCGAGVHLTQLAERAGNLPSYQSSPWGPRLSRATRVSTMVVAHGRAVIDPMAMNDVPEGHCRCCSRRDQTYRLVRWLGPVYTIYKIVSDHWPW